MMRPGIAFPSAEFEIVGVATAGALLSGALALLGPYLIALPGSLAALACAGWVAQLRRAAGGRAIRYPPGAGRAVAALGVGALVYLVPGPVAAFRGLVLAVALLPLWNLARRGPVGAP